MNQMIAVERCRWCRRIFSSYRAASIHEQRCRLQDGERPAFECRKCGARLASFGRARRQGLQYCLGSAVANLTCRKCGELFVHMQARRLHERFCADIQPDAGGMSIGDVLVGSRFVYPLALPGVIGQRLNISRMSTARIVGVVALSSSRPVPPELRKRN